MPRNSHFVRRLVRSACVHRSGRPLRLAVQSTILLVAGVLVAMVSCDTASACGWYRVRQACVSPCVVTSCCPQVYCYDPCASSYCESWSVTYDSGCGVSSAGCDTGAAMTPTPAEPHAAQRPPELETPAPSLPPTDVAPPTDLPTEVEPAPTAPAAAEPPVETPPAAEPSVPAAAAVPALPIVPATPASPVTEPPAAAEPPSPPPANTEPAAPAEPTAPAATTPAVAPDATTPPAAPAKEPDDLFGGAVEPPAAAAATPPAGNPPAATPEQKLEGLFDSPPAQTTPPAQPPAAQPPAATPKTEDKGSTDSLENLFNDNRQDRPVQQRPAIGGLASQQLRHWTDNTGRYSCQGRLLRVNRTAVRILKANGHTTTVSIRRLSQLDRAFVQAEVVASAERNGVRVAKN